MHTPPYPHFPRSLLAAALVGLACFAPSVHAAIPPDQAAALEKIRDALSPPQFEWYDGIDCDGFYIVCDADENVIGLGLYSGGGYLPPEIGELKYLEKFESGGTAIEFPLPDQLFGLERLTRFHVDLSHSTGAPIPEKFGEMLQLEHLGIQFAGLTGPIPDSLRKLRNLTHLDLAGNELTGEIPVWLSEMPSLEVVTLGANQFTGSVPGELTALTNLRRFDVSQTAVSGEIPRALVEAHAIRNQQTEWRSGNTALFLPLGTNNPPRQVTSIYFDEVPAWNPMTAAEMVWDAKVRSATLNGDRLRVEWSLWDWQSNQASQFQYVPTDAIWQLYARLDGESWQRVASTGAQFTSLDVDLPGASEAGKVEVHVRRQQQSGLDFNIAVESTGLQAGATEALKGTNTAPTVRIAGDVVLSDANRFDVDDAILANGYFGRPGWAIADWANQFETNDQDPQGIWGDVRHSSNPTLINPPTYSHPSGTLRVSQARDNFDIAGDTLIVMRHCDTPVANDRYWDTACGEEQDVFVISAGIGSEAEARLPSFQLNGGPVVVSDTDFAELEDFAINMLGVDNSADAPLAFRAAWLTGVISSMSIPGSVTLPAPCATKPSQASPAQRRSGSRCNKPMVLTSPSFGHPGPTSPSWRRSSSTSIQARRLEISQRVQKPKARPPTAAPASTTPCPSPARGVEAGGLCRLGSCCWA